MPIGLLLAYRFLRGTRHEQYVSFMVKLCFFGIALSTFALALVLSIAHGFEKATYKKLKGIHADGTLKARGKTLYFEKIKQIIEAEFKSSVSALSPTDTQQALIAQEETIGYSLFLKGIDPLTVSQISSLETMLIQKEPGNSFINLFAQDSVLIGSKIAENLSLKVGDSCKLLFVSCLETEKFDSYTVYIAGIVKTGIEELDEQLMFCSLDLLKKIFPASSITEIGFNISSKAAHKKTIELLKKRFSLLEVVSWEELYPSLVAALTLEKYVLMLILSLITLVASMNMVSLLSMYIHQKRKIFALCIVMGMSTAQSSALIIIMGMLIASSASCLGLVAAYLVGIFLQNYPLIKLPDAYYVTELPVELDLNVFLFIALVTLFISFIASWIPARNISMLPISHILRSEE